MTEEADKYQDWTDFAQKVAAELPSEHDSDKVAAAKNQNIKLKFKHIGDGKSWVHPPQNVTDKYPWLGELHTDYLSDAMALEDYNEYQLENRSYSEEEES